MTPKEIEPATFRFVAQHLSHCATAVLVMFEVTRQIIYVAKNTGQNAVLFLYVARIRKDVGQPFTVC